MKKLNWAVFNIETGFRLTDYKTRGGATLACENILKDQPDLRRKIGIRQKGFETSQRKVKNQLKVSTPL